MKKIIFTVVITILFKISAIAQCSCYVVEDLSIVGQDSMELVMSNACDQNVYLNLYVISSITPFDTLGRQERFAANFLNLNTNIANILSTNLTTPPVLGTYKVSITNGTFSCDSIKFAPTLNTTEIQDNSFKSISPNPVNSETTLQFKNFLNSASLIVYNSNGQIVKQVKDFSGQTLRLDLGNLSSGLYFIYVMQDNKLIAKDKLLISNN